MDHPLRSWTGRKVIVKSVDFTYRGTLREVTEETVAFMGRTGWREVAMEKVISIDLDPDAEKPAADIDVGPDEPGR